MFSHRSSKASKKKRAKKRGNKAFSGSHHDPKTQAVYRRNGSTSAPIHVGNVLHISSSSTVNTPRQSCLTRQQQYVQWNESNSNCTSWLRHVTGGSSTWRRACQRQKAWMPANNRWMTWQQRSLTRSSSYGQPYG